MVFVRFNKQRCIQNFVKHVIRGYLQKQTAENSSLFSRSLILDDWRDFQYTFLE